MPFNLAIKLYIEHLFHLFSFFKYRDFMFFVTSIFVVVKKHIVNSKSIFMLILVFVCHFLLYLSELFWSEFVRAATFIMHSPLFCSFESIYLPTIYLTICLYEDICPSFLKAVLSTETVPFIKNIYREIQIQTKALHELYWVV